MEKDCQKRGKKGIGDWGPGNRETGSTIQRVDEIAILANNNPHSLLPIPQSLSRHLPNINYPLFLVNER